VLVTLLLNLGLRLEVCNPPEHCNSLEEDITVQWRIGAAIAPEFVRVVVFTDRRPGAARHNLRLALLRSVTPNNARLGNNGTKRFHQSNLVPPSCDIQSLSPQRGWFLLLSVSLEAIR